MKKKALVLGLVITVTFTSLMPIKVVAENTKEIKVESVTDSIIKLNLGKAIEYALKNSKDMKIQEIELQKAEVTYDEGMRNVKRAENSVDEILTRDPETGLAIPEAGQNKALIDNGASRRSVKLAYQVSKWNKDMKINEIEYNVEKAYFDLLQMEKELSIAEENLLLSKEQYEHGKLRYDLGMISNQQLLGIEMGLSQAQSVLDSSKMYYELQLMSFQNTLGLPFNKQVNLTDIIEYKGYGPIDLSVAVKQGLDNNLRIKISQENYYISKLTLDGIKVRYPENTYRYREQLAEVAKAEKNLETAKNGVDMSVRSAVLNLATAEKQIKTYEKTIEQAQVAVKIAETSFDLGKNTATEVTQANINLMNAKSNLNKQIHAFNMALLDYEYSIGIGKGF